MKKTLVLAMAEACRRGRVVSTGRPRSSLLDDGSASPPSRSLGSGGYPSTVGRALATRSWVSVAP